MKKTVLAVFVAMAAASAAHASNVDVNRFVENVKAPNVNLQEAASAYNNLNARDAMVVDAIADRAGISSLLPDIKGVASNLEHGDRVVPAGWKESATMNYLHEMAPAQYIPGAPVAPNEAQALKNEVLTSAAASAARNGDYTTARRLLQGAIDLSNAQKNGQLDHIQLVTLSVTDQDKDPQTKVQLLVKSAAAAARSGNIELAHTYMNDAKELQAQYGDHSATYQVPAAPAAAAPTIPLGFDAHQAYMFNSNLTRTQSQIDALNAAKGTGEIIATVKDDHGNGSMTLIGVGQQEYNLAQHEEDIVSNKQNIADLEIAAHENNRHDLRTQQDVKDLTDNVTTVSGKVNSLDKRTSQIGTKAFDNGEAIAAIKPVVAQNTQAIADQKDFININAQNVKAVGTIAQGNKADIATLNTDTHMLAKGLNNETDNRVAADSKLAGAVTSVAGHVATTEKLVNQQGKSIATLQDATGALGEKVVAADRTNVRQDSELLKVGKQQQLMSVQIEHNRATGAYAQSRADAAYANTEANREALVNTNKRVSQNSADIANHEQRIQTLESNTNAKFGQLKSEVDQNRKRASAGIAGVAAMANIPQVIQGQTFSVGAGVGNTDGESALAVGMSARASENVVVKASVSNDTQHNFVVGAGVSYGW